MKRLFAALLIVCFPCIGKAVTTSNTNGVGTGSITYSFNATTRVLTWSLSVTGNAENQGNVSIRRASSGSDTTYGGTVIRSVSWSQNYAGSGTSGTYTIPSDWAFVRAEADVVNSVGATLTGINYGWLSMAAVPTATDQYKGINSTGKDVRIIVTDSAGSTVWDSGTIAPGAAYDSGVLDLSSTPTPVTAKIFFRAQYGDGIWTESPPTGDVPTTSPIASNPVPPQSTPTPTITDPLAGLSIVPGNSTSDPANYWKDGGPLWTYTTATTATTTATTLDKNTYKEGVGMVVAALQSGTGGTTTAPSAAAFPSSSEQTLAADAAKVNTLAGKFAVAPPVMPTIGVAENVEIPFVVNYKSVSMNSPIVLPMTTLAPQASIYRTSMNWVVAISFWFAAVVAVRQSVSSV